MRALTYGLVDELEFACAAHERRLPKLEIVVRSLGPLIQMHRSPAREQIRTDLSISYDGFHGAWEFLKSSQAIYIDHSDKFGLAVARRDNDAAIELMQRALVATNRSALPSAAAAQVVSALGELESNIHEHSGDRSTGLVAYEVSDAFAAVYASDIGMGVLSSLRTNPNFSEVEDAGEALRLALQEGVSSSTDPGRGMGFRPLFVGLASHSGFLRFRSGDAVLDLNGFGHRPTQEVKERAAVSGLHVFVHCAFRK